MRGVDVYAWRLVEEVRPWSGRRSSGRAGEMAGRLHTRHATPSTALTLLPPPPPPPPPPLRLPSSFLKPQSCLAAARAAFEDIAVGDEAIKRAHEQRWQVRGSRGRNGGCGGTVGVVDLCVCVW